MTGGMGSRVGRAGVSSWSDLPVSGRAEVTPRSDLPLNRILYIPFSIFAYSSNIVMANLVRIESMLAEGTLKYSRFSLSSAPFRDRAPATKLRWCITQPERCMTLPKVSIVEIRIVPLPHSYLSLCSLDANPANRATGHPSPVPC